MMISKNIFPIILLLTAACNNKSGKASCAQFEFRNLNVDTNKWAEEAPFERMTESFFRENREVLKPVSYSYSENLFKVCNIETKNLDGNVIAQLNGPNWEMYFIPKSEGETFLVACFEVSPNDFLEKRSQLIGENLKQITVRINEGGEKDSIVSHYAITKNRFTKIKSDSLRIN